MDKAERAVRPTRVLEPATEISGNTCTKPATQRVMHFHHRTPLILLLRLMVAIERESVFVGVAATALTGPATHLQSHSPGFQAQTN